MTGSRVFDPAGLRAVFVEGVVIDIDRESIATIAGLRQVFPEQVQPAKQEVEVVLSGEQPDRERVALGLRGTGTRLVESTSPPERTFQLAGATNRNVGVIVVDLDVYGLGFLLALGSIPATLGRAVQAGANVALPRSTPAEDLARMIAQLGRQNP